MKKDSFACIMQYRSSPDLDLFFADSYINVV